MSDVTASLETPAYTGSSLALAALAYRLARTLDEKQLAAVTPLLRPEAVEALRALYERTVT